MNVPWIIDRESRLFNWFVNLLTSANIFVATLTLNCVDAIKIFINDVPKGYFYIDSFLEFFKKITWTCLPIATLTVSASSIVSSIHTAPEFSKHGLTVYLGGLVALSLIREGVPVMATLAIVTQFCTGITAQIGSMKITEQIDAMKIVKVHPNAYVLVPMLVAGIIGFPIVIVICVLIGILVNYFFSAFLIDITYSLYTTSIITAVDMKDILLSLIKASTFGFTVNLVSYTCGILTKGGAKAVGDSIRLSVIINFALVLILDYIITALWF